ncbi:family 16 glycosylhydrolase [Corallococcus sp. CA041A]|uniref:family 16 glycosylhydrolase n=1 Tax=Corallococcus sp. CA041A TaxID=2316727 RepID=UPI0013151906|nr:family 16 glycosylhydrolase [Corallococcus sp. CA041A]
MIERIYVINLDRAQDRWSALNRELGRLKDGEGRPLSAISRRFSAIDARYIAGPPPANLLEPTYTLAEQLFVAPEPKLTVDDFARATRIAMTPQEIAVALSHISVWKLIAASDAPYTLVLEDDVYVTRTCMSVLDRAWNEMLSAQAIDNAVDLVYLSYKETGEGKTQTHTGSALRRPTRGLWQLSGYVLSRKGAEKLLSLLPAHGPIDLWINLQFRHLSVRMTEQSVIEQRAGVTSSNSYSVLPVLSKVGAIQHETPLLARRRSTKGPLVAVGMPGTGLSTVAEALSVLGFRCISDVADICPDEREALLRGRRSRTFDAYVNIGSLGPSELKRISSNSSLSLIVTTGPSSATGSPAALSALGEAIDLPPHRCLVLPVDNPDPWERLSRFLDCDYPTHPWPHQLEQGQRRVIASNMGERMARTGRRLTWDTSPWIVGHTDSHGVALDHTIPLREVGNDDNDSAMIDWQTGARLDDSEWYLRNDTFPSNRAIFQPDNVTRRSNGPTTLTLRRESSRVRDFTGAAIASRQYFTYGTFAADLRVPSGSGLVSGLFLHRNGPRQEIDIEFLGRDTTRMLVNVFYNPGIVGTRLEYGYRGTPVLIELGFDAAKAFHHYEIEWQPECIRWRVDGVTVHERFPWGPTPIPNQPLEFNVNLWNSESIELAGVHDEEALPAMLKVASLSARSRSGTPRHLQRAVGT